MARAETHMTLFAEIKRRVRGRTVTLKSKFADFQIITRSRSLLEPTRIARVWRRLFKSYLRLSFRCGKAFVLLGSRSHRCVPMWQKSISKLPWRYD